MSKLIFLISLITGLGIVENKPDLEDRALLLTSGDKKTWYLYGEIPENSEPTCKASGNVMADNTYTFFANGSFEFDHGTVTEDVDCTNENCCTDFVNVVGTWRFANNQNGLVVKALYEKDKRSNAETLLIFSGTIIQLDESVLKFSEKDPDTGIPIVFEFRKK